MNVANKSTNTKSIQSTHSTQFPESRRENSTQTSFRELSSRHVRTESIKFKSFLQNASQMILNELENDFISQAFTMWNGYFDQDDVDYSSNIITKQLFVFSSQPITRHDYKQSNEKDHNGNLMITQIDWNASGSILVVVYGNRDSIGLGRSPGLIELWGVGGSDSKPPEKPIASLEFESELNCVAAHPQNPTRFAAGSKNGEILLFDYINNNLSLHATSKVGQYFHNAAITSIVWHCNKNDKEWMIYSTGLDSKILLWKLTNALNYPLHGYYLQPIMKEKQVNNENSAFVANALVTVSNNEHATTVLIGCDCGNLLISLNTDDASYSPSLNTLMKWSSNAKDLVLKMLPSHRAKVVKRAEDHAKLKKKQGVDRSTLNEIRIPPDMMYPPFPHRSSRSNFGRINSVDHCNGSLLSCGEDGIVQLYSMDDLNELKVEHKIDNSFKLNEIKHTSKAIARFCTENIIALSCGSGNVLIYDKNTSMQEPVAVLFENKSAFLVSYLAFNSLTKVLAVSRRDGSITLWQLSF